MAVTISNSSYSFVNWEAVDENFCPNEPRICLPVLDMGDIGFQAIATVSGADKLKFNSGDRYWAGMPTGVSTWEKQFDVTWTKIVDGVGAEPDIWVGNFVSNGDEAVFTALSVGECFTIDIYKHNVLDDSEEFLVTCTNCFTKILDTCYTSLMIYRANNDAFGFYYSDYPNYSNSIRLSFYLHSPFKTEEKKQYEKSNGATVITSYRLWKNYELKTDYWDARIHDNFEIALAHNIIVITNPYANIEDEFFTNQKPLEIDWQEKDIPGFKAAIAMGALRMSAPMANVNSNCSS